MEAGDFVGAQKFVTKAQRLFPNLENIVQMITICDVHSSAIKKIKGLDDWYGVLQVQPFADADTIRKQYRKLALLLHPDKNKFASAEAAFKLVGEANRLLSDQIKRSQYDNRYRSHSMLAKKQVHAYSGRHCAATNNDAENIASVYTFWTRCRHCGQWYKYLRKYINTVMYCSSCRKSYVACNMRCDGVPPSSSTAGRKEFQYQGMYNTSRQKSRQNASTGAESGGSAAEMGKNGTAGKKLNKKNQEKQKKGAANREPKKDEGCTENDAEGRNPQNSETGTNNSAEIPKADILKPQHQVKEPLIRAKSIPDLSAPKKNQAAKKKRKAVEESSKSFEVDSSAGAKTDTHEYNKRKSSRKKPQVFCTKGGSDGDFVSPPKKKTKSGCEFESEFDTKQTAEDNQSSELADSPYKGKAKKNVHSGNEEILSCKNKVCEGCDGNGEDAALLSKIGRVEKGYKVNENPNPLDIPDPEFSAFKVERNTGDFAVNQVWSTTTDSRDGMPRKYARVKKVLNGEFKLWITYLDPVLDKNDESIPVACGKFKNGKTEEVEDRFIFSVQMHHLSCNKTVSIYPRKGEIWAIFREWDAEWNTSLEKHKLPYKYDFVEIVSDFHDLKGVGVAYLGKLKGSVQLFHWEPQNGICQIQFTPKDMLRFSHKVPAVKMTGKEKECVPPNSYELDPAALPKDIFQVDAVDMEMDSEILKGKPDGPVPEASKVGAKAKPVPETAPSPRKRRKSDDDMGVCSNVGEVIGGTNRSHIFSSCEVDEKKNTPNKSREDGEATDVFKLGKSPRLQTIPSQQEDEKKRAKQGNKMNTPKKIEQQTNELGVMHRKKRDLALILDKIEESGKQLATVDGQLGSRRKLLKIRSFKLFTANKKLVCVRKSIRLSCSDLKQKERMIHSLNNRVTVCGNTFDSKSKELGEIQKLIDQHTNELVVLRTQRDSIWQLIKGLSEELVAKEMELECVLESSKDFKFDIDVKEKRVQALNNLITISGEQLDIKSKELGEIQRELDLKKKRLRHMSTVLVKHEKQPAAADSAPFSEDALTDHEFSPSLSRDEVAYHLRALPNPAEFVLEDVQEYISGELGLQDDSFLEILVLCLEELIEIQRRDDPQLQNKATQVATIWKGKITIEAPKSSLEALAFLLFIVAYGLKNLINEEEAALLASSIAHYEQAPRLFKSLSLNCEIRKFVKALIKKEQYIPAVRLVCLFKLNEEFSPSHLLEKEIINLRWSVLGKRPTQSSQAKEKDAGRLRAILELVGDYKLEINIPGYLIAKLMIQRENSPPLVRCSVKHGTSSTNPQANSPNPASAHCSPNPASAHCSPNPAYAHRSPNPASAQSSSVNPQVPKPDVKPCLN
ncbi:uncharacterized protein LOC9298680 [Arabidopsis lyrata subsp. lyrata]|nr:uncharacterized protein LOC9298680 [Arabidopsis lyrata subsp. lyrata]|eukprot:XP_002862604.2 uncharacterized protein LOC9298680 [Arabidopsis lyrata subsp. lyrata]